MYKLNLDELRKMREGIINAHGVSNMTLTEYVRDIVDENTKPEFDKLTVEEQDNLIALKIKSFDHDVDIVLSQETNKALVTHLIYKSADTENALMAAVRSDLVEQFAYEIDEALTERQVEVHSFYGDSRNEYSNVWGA